MTTDSLIIDGLNFYMRHFAANPSMGGNGQHIGGAVGFLKGIQLLCERCMPKSITVVWEGGGSPRKRAAAKNYKGGRKPQGLNRYYQDIPDTVENRDYQLMLLIELLRFSSVRQLYIADCEADDIIGQLCMYKHKSLSTVIVSSDRDYYQLLSDSVRIWSPGRKIFVMDNDVKDQYHVSQANFLTARAFVGDPSDNLSGIKGAGFKTLAKRFPELCGEVFISVEGILKLSIERSRVSKLKLFKEINENADIPQRNWRVMYLGDRNLAASQILKLRALLDSEIPKLNKLGFIRALLREEIKDFDVNRLFFALKCIRD